ncbi:MAG: 50S ribosomal protein L24e [Candidatus Micrarchaeota archaeon]|nr:50S ribosomal protein L24e [Candidatus Micrarchaeota archaeon]
MKCTYCSREIPKGTGTMYVHKTGTLNYFCSNRCFKNSKMKRKMNKKELRNK